MPSGNEKEALTIIADEGGQCTLGVVSRGMGLSREYSGIHPLQRTMAFACDKCKGQGVMPKRARARNSRAKKTTLKQKQGEPR